MAGSKKPGFVPAPTQPVHDSKQNPRTAPSATGQDYRTGVRVPGIGGTGKGAK